MSWRDVRLNILPVFIDYMLDGGIPALPSGLPPPRGYSAEEVEEFTKKTMETLRSSSRGVELLDPYLIRSEEDFNNLREALTADVDFLLPIQVGHEYRAGWRDTAPVIVGLGDFMKPIIAVSISVWGFDYAIQPVSALRAAGREAYFAADLDDLNNLLKVLRAKKALSKSKLVVFSRGPKRVGPVGNISDPVLIKKKLGVEVEYWDANVRLRSIVDTVSPSEAEAEGDRWIKEAVEIKPLYRKEEVDRKYIVNQSKLYLGLKKMLEETGAAGLSGCAASGGLRPIDGLHSPPCFSYVKLKDEGVPCGCEADLNATLAMMMLMYLSEKPADMGNVCMPTKEPDMEDFEVPNPPPNTIVLNHSVTPLKPDGFNTPPNPYIICGTHCDTCWGPNTYTEVRPGQEVTIARLSPLLDKMLIVEGKIRYSKLTPAQGNRECVYIDVPDRMKLFHVQADYGNHLTYVYGSYGKELGELCKLLSIQPEYI